MNAHTSTHKTHKHAQSHGVGDTVGACAAWCLFPPVAATLDHSLDHALKRRGRELGGNKARRNVEAHMWRVCRGSAGVVVVCGLDSVLLLLCAGCVLNAYEQGDGAPPMRAHGLCAGFCARRAGLCALGPWSE